MARDESEPLTRYAQCGEAYVAYQTLGSGPPLMLIADWFSHLHAQWEWPAYAHALRRLASMGHLVVFDKRSTGLSDPVEWGRPVTLEDWVDDVHSVLDDAGVEETDLIAVGAGATLAMQFAAVHPERVSRLVLINAYARLLRADDYPAGYPERLRDRILASVYTDPGAANVLGGPAADAPFVAWWQRFQRQAVSPSVAARLRRMMFDVDVRALLPAISAPALVLHRRDDEWVRPAHGRYLAEHLPNALYEELDGAEDLFFRGDADGLLDRVEAFLSGEQRPIEVDRVLATIMFTDLVGSTQLATDLGDRRWRILLDDHDAIVGRQLAVHGGRAVHSTGDGQLAVFDGAARAIRCAAKIRDELRGIGLHVRAGVHAGEVELRNNDIGGIAVHVAARITDRAGSGEIYTSRIVRDLVAGSGITFVPIGSTVLRGVGEEVELLLAAI